jgi:hypothetical protein
MISDYKAVTFRTGKTLRGATFSIFSNPSCESCPDLLIFTLEGSGAEARAFVHPQDITALRDLCNKVLERHPIEVVA